ncbi:hypothetical protein [Rubrivivax albus]|uniref:Lipoprotein n=1 Tax=Rubrivivax albus TaxID=2499835 RepID=A0A3S2U2P7_9BURK|nr:hypothetical protein [Rubrivivax albus]RVT51311.1 hypothetical protein ENE75_10725 [Rubrivivax albus]
MKTSALAALVAIGLLGCTQGQQASPAAPAPAADTSALAQTEICATQEVRVETGCKPGQRVVFMPSRFGNEQLPVMFASMNCDLRYAVAMTNGGVTCIFIKVRAPQSEAPGGASAAAPGQPASNAAGK